MLVAAFANSPLRRGRPTGWRSSRQQVWAHMDPGRTRPPELNGDPRDDWAAYALDAQVMCVRDDGSGDWTAPPGLTLRDWVRGGAVEDRLRPPTTEDLVYHLSTLFPPVRPRGHLELRMIDAQPGDGWIVPPPCRARCSATTRAGDDGHGRLRAALERPATAAAGATEATGAITRGGARAGAGPPTAADRPGQQGVLRGGGGGPRPA